MQGPQWYPGLTASFLKPLDLGKCQNGTHGGSIYSIYPSRKGALESEDAGWLADAEADAITVALGRDSCLDLVDPYFLRERERDHRVCVGLCALLGRCYLQFGSHVVVVDSLLTLQGQHGGACK